MSQNYGFTFLDDGKFLLNNVCTEILTSDLWNEYLMTQIAMHQFRFLIFLNTHHKLKKAMFNFLLTQIDAKCQDDNLNHSHKAKSNLTFRFSVPSD